jgi:hypothetical protein
MGIPYRISSQASKNQETTWWRMNTDINNNNDFSPT